MTATIDYDALLAAISLRFSSSNTAPVSCAYISRAEWEAICALRAAAVESELDAEKWRNHNAREFPAFGCHCDTDDADQCCIDTGHPNDCVYATKLVAAGKDKHSCDQWRPVNIKAMAAQEKENG